MVQVTKKAKVVKSETKGMFRVRFSDGILSQDHYNLTRAKNHVTVISENERRSCYR